MSASIWQERTLVHCWQECKLTQPLQKTIWRFLKKLKVELSYYPTVSLLGRYLKKTKNTNAKRYVSSVFTAALFTIVKVWRQPKCPWTDEWIKKIRYLFAMQYYLAIKKRTKFANCSSMNGLVGHYWVRSLGREDPLEKEIATLSSILAWRIPWMEELGGLQFTGRKESDTAEWLHFHFHAK